MDSPGFKRFKAQRAAKAAADADYEAFTAAMRGPDGDANGRAQHLQPGGEDTAAGLSDGEIYRGYLAELDGTAARRRSEENAKRERIEREQEVVRYAKTTDSAALSRSHEHLRDRIPGAGRPHEGS